MKKILFAGYRDWSIDVFGCVRSSFTHDELMLRRVRSQDELEFRARTEDWDALILMGWSWKIPADIINKMLVVGMHPSDLPAYAGGSPIQNQIIDGLKESKATLFKLNENFDSGEIIAKQSYSLEGHLGHVFDEIMNASICLVCQFIKAYPNVNLVPQGEGGFTRKRLKPEQSTLTREQFDKMKCNELYDFIRCREDPYPNVVLEDETGELIFTRVEFRPRVQS